MSSHCPFVWPTLSPSCKSSSDGIRMYEFISGRSKCGMPVELSFVLVRSSSGLLTRLETESQCGRVLDCRPSCRASKVLGTPLGHPDFVAAHLDRVLSDRTLLERIQRCKTSQVRVVRPPLTEAFAMGHDEGLWRCRCEILQVPLDTGVLARDIASLPLALGGLGLRSAVRSWQCARGGFGDKCGSSFLGGSRGLPGCWCAPTPPPLDDPGGWRTGWQQFDAQSERH